MRLLEIIWQNFAHARMLTDLKPAQWKLYKQNKIFKN